MIDNSSLVEMSLTEVDELGREAHPLNSVSKGKKIIIRLSGCEIISVFFVVFIFKTITNRRDLSK